MNTQTNQFRDTALVGVSRIKFRELINFDSKLHSIPTKADDRSLEFAAKVADADIEKHIEPIFQKLRKTFKLKRVEAKVSRSEPGWGLIETPHFAYSINASLDENDLSTVIFEKSIREIQNPDLVGSDEFAAIFDFMFDRIEITFEHPILMEDWIDNIEQLDDERFELDYDSALTHCVLNIADIAATINVTESKFSIVYPQTAPTNQILVAYVEACDAVAHGFD